MSEALHRTVADLHKIAEEKGLVVVIPQDNELILDMDVYPFRPNSFVLNCLRTNEIVIVDALTTVSASGKRHLYYRLDRDFNMMERIALQACLGSDPVKETLSMLRGREWDVPTAMFETPAMALNVDIWRAKHRTDIRRGRL